MTRQLGTGIDCDVRPAVPNLQALLPHLDEPWREIIVMRGLDDLHSISYPPNAPISCRPDWRLPGVKPGADFDRLRRDALDHFDTGIAIANCLYAVQVLFSEDLAAAMARAVNTWMAKEYLDRDSRLRASIVIGMQNVEHAVNEIERCAQDTRFVQVLVLAGGDAPLGKRHLWPIYAAAERHGLPIGIPAGSSYHQAPAPTGWPC